MKGGSAAAFSDFAPLRGRLQAEMMRRTPDHIARLAWSGEQIAEHQRKGLRALLSYAVEHSPFHARRLAGFDPARFELEELSCLPTMTKAQLMAEFDDVTTDRRVTRALAEQALSATGSEPQPLFDKYVCMSSGGSSGIRGLFVFDLHAMAEFLLSVNRVPIRRMLLAGGPPPGGVTIAMVAAGSAVHATGASSAWAEGGPTRSVRIPATLPLEEIVERLDELKPTVLAGYPSVLARLARERLRNRLRIAPVVVSCTSENLLPEWQAAISEAFGVPVTNAFGSTEGLVGMSEPGELALSFNSDVCIVETVDEAGAPVPPGVPSHHILLTNLANHAQPLIRYLIDDRFVQQPPAPDHGHLRAIVEGRSGDLLRFGAIEIHPLVIGSVLTRAGAVSDYQVRQTARGIDVRLQADSHVDLDELRAQLVSALSAAGLPGAEVVVHPVAALDRAADTGKLRRFFPA